MATPPPRTPPPRTPNFPPEQKSAAVLAAAGFVINVIPGIPEEAKSNATDLALAIAPALTFGGVGLRAARAKFLSEDNLTSDAHTRQPRRFLPDMNMTLWALIAIPWALSAVLLGITIWLTH